jgi:cell division inhibitor SulA
MKQLPMYNTEIASPTKPAATAFAPLRERTSPLRCPNRAAATEANAKLGNVTEIILSPTMANSFQILLPMLTQLNQENRWLAWVNPPAELVHSWRQQAGIASDEIMILRSNKKISAFELAQRALNAGTCHAVVTWTSGLSVTELSQLEIASYNGNSHGLVLRLR